MISSLHSFIFLGGERTKKHSFVFIFRNKGSFNKNIVKKRKYKTNDGICHKKNLKPTASLSKTRKTLIN